MSKMQALPTERERTLDLPSSTPPVKPQWLIVFGILLAPWQAFSLSKLAFVPSVGHVANELSWLIIDVVAINSSAAVSAT
jgi:hypothetical protein